MAECQHCAGHSPARKRPGRISIELPRWLVKRGLPRDPRLPGAGQPGRASGEAPAPSEAGWTSRGERSLLALHEALVDLPAPGAGHRGPGAGPRPPPDAPRAWSPGATLGDGQDPPDRVGAPRRSTPNSPASGSRRPGLTRQGGKELPQGESAALPEGVKVSAASEPSIGQALSRRNTGAEGNVPRPSRARGGVGAS